MKKLLLFAMLLIVAFVQAQVNEKDLKGSWIVTAIETDEVTLYPLEGDAVLKEAGREGLTAEEIEDKEVGFSVDSYQYADVTMLFENGKVITRKDSQESEGAFTLVNGELRIDYGNGEPTVFAVSIKDKKLHLRNEQSVIILEPK
jgi:hypothetical protein